MSLATAVVSLAFNRTLNTQRQNVVVGSVELRIQCGYYVMVYVGVRCARTTNEHSCIIVALTNFNLKSPSDHQIKREDRVTIFARELFGKRKYERLNTL